MAGTYTHLSVVRSIYGNKKRFTSIQALSEDIKYALKSHSQYIDLGAISPDCPYLYRANYNKEANSWGDLMHYHRSANFVQEGIRNLMNEDMSQKDTRVAVSWLFGYTAHLVTDLTIHPVVKLKVGDYARNKKKHKFCELQQDAYIFNKKLGLNISEAEYIKGAGFRNCTNSATDKTLHHAIVALWSKCIEYSRKSCNRKKYNHHIPEKEPAPHKWFWWFILMIDKGAEEGCNFPGAYYLLRKFGLSYPKNQEDIDYEYIRGLSVPGGKILDFSHVFDMAIMNVTKYWGELSLALQSKNPGLFTLENGDLDTGIGDDSKSLIFWNDNL